ncbi:uncharacterized protein LOC136037110 [Artemia franciscana]|uniref:uncharacterized protein LOC136037110 n=1 Tax=Artemia franciscana TaxID=6661 RepID=UPI0032DB305F
MLNPKGFYSVFVITTSLVCIQSCLANFGPEATIVNKIVLSKFLETCCGNAAASKMRSDMSAASEKCLTMSSNFQVSDEMVKASAMRPRFVMTQGKLAKIAKMVNIVGNITCRMQELNLMTAEFEPNFEGIEDRIQSMPYEKKIGDAMMKNMKYCRSILECTEDESASEILPPFFPPALAKTKSFFKCLMERKVMFCVKEEIKKRMMENFSAEEDSPEGIIPLDMF